MRFGSSTLGNIPLVVKNLLIINVIVFLAQQALPQIGFNVIDYFALFHWKSELFMPHQFITYMFLHADWSHLFFNMFGLYIFGRVLEGIMGPKRFLSFYLITGIGAAVIQLISKEVQIQHLASQLDPELLTDINERGLSLFNLDQVYIDSGAHLINILINIPMIGASGAIFGILVAFGYMFPNAQLMLLFPPIPIKGKYIAILALFMGIALDFSGNVAHLAHFGGMLTGFILLKLWRVKSNSFRI